MTGREPGEEIRGVRRIFLVALAAALVAAAVTLSLELARQPASTAGSPAASSLLPQTFRQPGFADGTLHRQRQVTLPGTVLRRTLQVGEPAGSVVYVVARCDRGTVTVRLGGLTSSQRCTGRPVGLVRLTLSADGVGLDVSVDQPQLSSWATGIYR
ncbi:MAG TPA: hypothetical protein VFJ98_00745 [Mycobacteriales bacterium]|nr:hypothetical protein [Mycobacteriales bacterium]